MVDEQVDDGCSKVDGKMSMKERTSIYPSIRFFSTIGKTMAWKLLW